MNVQHIEKLTGILLMSKVVMQRIDISLYIQTINTLSFNDSNT